MSLETEAINVFSGVIYDFGGEHYTFMREFNFQEPTEINQNITISITLPYSMIPSEKEQYYISFIGYGANWKNTSDYDKDLIVTHPDLESKDKLKIKYHKFVKNSKNFSLPITIYYKVVEKEPPLIAYQEDEIIDNKYKTNVYWITNNYNRSLNYAIDVEGNELLQSLYLWDSEIESKPNAKFHSGVLTKGVTTELLNQGILHYLNNKEIKDCEFI